MYVVAHMKTFLTGHCISSIMRHFHMYIVNVMIYLIPILFDTEAIVIDKSQQYGEILGECGGGFWQRSGRFSSPGYPQGYPPDSFCFWEIRAPPNYVIELEFSDFDLEWSTFECHKDKVLVLDTESAELGSLCGGTLPGRLVSSGPSLTVGLIADQQGGGKGFMANYSMVRDNSIDFTTHPQVTVPDGILRHYDDCGGTINDLAALIFSPQYPRPYPPNTICIWNINPPQGHHLYLTFDVLDLEAEEDPECVRDFVEVLDSQGQVLTRFCGTQTPEFVMTSPSKMAIILKSDRDVAGSGFVISYTTNKPTDKKTVYLGQLESNNVAHEEL